jgi:dTDP-4-dehydrorhamnose 3,5-epimerase
MKVIQTPLNDCVIIEPRVFSDERGFFLETYKEQSYKKEAGIYNSFVQDNHSRSSKGVLRGLHFQKNKPQGKLVRVVLGEVYDVAVDLRENSSTYLKWVGVYISESNKKQVWIPPGFAHGFQVLSDFADFEYKCTEYYDPSDEGCISWNDPTLNIDWPIRNPLVSQKDLNAKTIKNYK